MVSATQQPLVETPPQKPAVKIKLSAQHLNFYYGPKHALADISVDIPENRVTAFIGPSGCGKSTFLRCFNRMNDLIDGTRVEGKITMDGMDLYAPEVDPVELRKVVGMVFQKPNPFPKSIYENVAYGPKVHGVRRRHELDEIVERCLKGAALWDEVKNSLHKSAFELSGGQQQRLCIARTMAVDPKVILMDEPCSALDPIATGKIEDLILELKAQYTVVIVTHNMGQAQRTSDNTAFFLHGRLIEYSKTEGIFLNPQRKETEDYISGRFG